MEETAPHAFLLNSGVWWCDSNDVEDFAASNIVRKVNNGEK